MKKNRLKSKLMVIGLVAAFVIVAVLAVIIILGNKKLQETRQQVDQLTEEITSNKQLVYVASVDIEKGAQVTPENCMQQQIYTGLPSTSYMTAEEIGKTAIVDIKANEPIMSNMVTAIKLTKDMRKYEVMSVHLMTTQKEHDTVDIRIMFPNGEDYLLFSKKIINDLQMGTSIFTLYLNEDEILRMSSAIVDVYTTTGAKMYTVKYVEENIQEEAIPNYPVKPEILDLINSDPNIIEVAETTLNIRARNDLDRRLGALSEEFLGAMAAGHNIEDTASSSVIRQGIVMEEQEAAAAEAAGGQGAAGDAQNAQGNQDAQGGQNPQGNQNTQAPPQNQQPAEPALSTDMPQPEDNAAYENEEVEGVQDVYTEEDNVVVVE